MSINAHPPLILMNVMSTKTNADDPIRRIRREVDSKGEHA
jgi:hypothetical protein